MRKMSIIAMVAIMFILNEAQAQVKKTLPALDPLPKKGVFALTNTSNWLIVDGKRIDLFDCEVDGVVNYITWDMVEPLEGKFRFPGLDRMLNKAQETNKYLAYNIISGSHAPDWVYERTKSEPFTYSVPDGRIRKT